MKRRTTGANRLNYRDKSAEIIGPAEIMLLHGIYHPRSMA